MKVYISDCQFEESTVLSIIDKIFNCLLKYFLYIKNGFNIFLFDITFDDTFDNIHLNFEKTNTMRKDNLINCKQFWKQSILELV